MHSLCTSLYIPPLQHTTHYTGEQPCWLIKICSAPLPLLNTCDRLSLNVGSVMLQIRALDKKANKIEKLKNKKGGHNMWNEVHELGQLIR